MSTIHENILSLCDEAGIKAGKMCSDLGMSRSLITDLKSGRKKGITAATAQKIADYFHVSVDRVIDGKEKTPSDDGERQIGFDDFTYAMHDHSGDLTDQDKEILLQMARQLAAANRRKTNGETD